MEELWNQNSGALEPFAKHGCMGVTQTGGIPETTWILQQVAIVARKAKCHMPFEEHDLLVVCQRAVVVSLYFCCLSHVLSPRVAFHCTMCMAPDESGIKARS